MNIMGPIACVIVALECAENATFKASTILFGTGYEWLWWVAMAAWVWHAIDQLGYRR